MPSPVAIGVVTYLCVVIKQQPVILFDGVCNLCNRSVQFILMRDPKKQFLFASLQGKVAGELLKTAKRSDSTYGSIILVEGDRIYSQSTAVLRVARRLGGGWRLLYGLIIVPRFIRDAVYSFVARNRYRWFGKKDECMIPSPQWKDRFLE